MFKTYKLMYGIVIISIAMVLHAATHRGEVLTGVVTKVYDGDTITLDNGAKIRLAEIDAPELHQEYGKESQALLEKMVLTHQVRVEVENTDRYGRYVGNIFTEDQVWVNHRMVLFGRAWRYTTYSKSDKIEKAQEWAKWLELGIWADTNSVPPWEWRKQQKTKK